MKYAVVGNAVLMNPLMYMVLLSLWLIISLVPRPFPPPVFDRILYAKTEGEGLGERFTCVTSGRREGRH